MSANRTVDKRNALPDICMEYTTLNDFEQKLQLKAEHTNMTFVMVEDSRLYYGESLCRIVSSVFLQG